MVYMLLDLKFDRNAAKTTVAAKIEPFRIKDVLDLFSNRAYIYIALICVTFYSAVFPFMAFAPDFFFHKFSMTYEKSGQIASLLPLGTLLFTPFFGFLIDRNGKAATAMIFGSLTIVRGTPGIYIYRFPTLPAHDIAGYCFFAGACSHVAINGEAC